VKYDHFRADYYEKFHVTTSLLSSSRSPDWQIISFSFPMRVFSSFLLHQRWQSKNYYLFL